MAETTQLNSRQKRKPGEFCVYCYVGRVQLQEHRKKHGGDHGFKSPDPRKFECICSPTLWCLDPACEYSRNPMIDKETG